jgi:hypothetical protein
MHQPWDYLFEGQKIKSKGWDGMYILVDAKSSYRIETGQKVKHDGSTYTVTGGRAPHKPSSQGKLWVKENVGMGGEIYPSVAGLKWLKIKD